MANQFDASSYIGKSCEPAAVSYNTRDLIIYALGIGCEEMRFVFEQNEDFAVFPTYPIVLAFKGTSNDVVDFPSDVMGQMNVTPPLPGVKTGLDGERYMEFLHPLPNDGSELQLTNKLVACNPKGKGAAVESEQLLQDANGKVYVRMLSSAFLVGAKNFQGAGKSLMPTHPKPARAPDCEAKMTTSPTQTHIYRLSGDYNPLHIDSGFAQMFGFKEPILHGLCTMGHVARAVLQTYCDNDPALMTKFKVRFSKPVLPGETLLVSMWKQGTIVVVEAAVMRKGKRVVVVSNAFAEVVGPKANL